MRTRKQRSGPEVIKPFSYSTQQRIKFQLLIRTKAEKDGYFLLLSSHMIYLSANKC